jgi:phospholipid-translocating ATPase
VAIPIYTGWLMVGYATIFTFLPVFSLVLDEDVSEQLVNYYPELYKELQKGRPLSYKTFLVWILQSVYQGGVIMLVSIYLFESRFLNVVSITFTALIWSQYLNVALEVQKWHYLMWCAQLLSAGLYVLSMFLLPAYFDLAYILSWEFVWRVLVLTATSFIPVYIAKCTYSRLAPSSASKIH